jgi:quercetin dioxygenase-like cupin family protein
MPKLPVCITTTILTALMAVTTAGATPPSGITIASDTAWGVAAEEGTIRTPAGTGMVTGAYLLAPRASAGWRTLPGTALLIVTGGTMTVTRAEGCATQEYEAGQAAVVPAGRSLVANRGDDPLALYAVFVNLPGGATDPLAGPGETPADGCTGVTATPVDISVAGLTRGTFGVPEGHYHHGQGPAPDAVEQEAGKAIYVGTSQIYPGTSVGWHRHPKLLAVLTKGEQFNYYQGRDGRCERTASYQAGDAFAHVQDAHTKEGHLAVNEGDEVVEVVVVAFNRPGQASPVPLVGNAAGLVDHTPLPPADCPRLR